VFSIDFGRIVMLFAFTTGTDSFEDGG